MYFQIIEHIKILLISNIEARSNRLGYMIIDRLYNLAIISKYRLVEKAYKTAYNIEN